MRFKDKRDLWYVSGNKERGDVFAVPVTEVEEGAVVLDSDIARLKDSDVDGARRWVVVASTGEEAVEKLARFCLKDPEESLPALSEKTGIPYDTLVAYARSGKILARKSGGVWLSTKRAIEAVGIKPRQSHRKEVGNMPNSYGFDGNIPANAIYGVYDSENGEWTGKFFSNEADAQEAANELKGDLRLGVVSVTDDEDWL